jgi:hypothetical protein
MSLRASTLRSRPLLMLGGAATCAVAGACALAACILADPPPDLPKLAPHAPIILNDSVTPPLNRILLEWPQEFVVPVELLDRQSSFSWRVFVNYDPPFHTEIGPFASVDAAGNPDLFDGGVTTVRFRPLQPDPNACNRIEFVVARSFDPQSAHTPDSLGGSSVTWFYDEGGHCPQSAFDGSADGAFPDVGSDVLIVPDSGTDGGGD